jgi:hypothetical protein
MHLEGLVALLLRGDCQPEESASGRVSEGGSTTKNDDTSDRAELVPSAVGSIAGILDLHQETM